MKPINVTCPDCNGPMRSRTSAHGVFWGCCNYPRCRGTRDSLGRSKAERIRDRDDDWRDRGIRHGLPFGSHHSRRYDT